MKKPDFFSLKTFSWALYDFANTIFSMNVISLYFPLWVTITVGAEDIYLSYAISASMLAVAFTAPSLGNLSDRKGYKLPFILLFTLISVFFTALIGFSYTLLAGLILFAVANYCYQAGLIFYDALLPRISPKGMIGKVSGMGVALGYLGTIFGILMVQPFVRDKSENLKAFIPTAVLFLLFSIPLFVFVKEERAVAKASESVSFPLLKTYKRLKEASAYPGILPYLIAHFLYLDTINTVIAFMSVYAVKVMGFSQEGGQVQKFLMISTASAVFGSFIIGFITDRLMPKKSLQIVLLLWVFTLLLIIFAPSKAFFYIAGGVAGIALGGIWTADRPLLISLTPPEKIAEFFGLYYMSGKFAAVLGPLIWGGVVWGFEPLGIFKYKIAVFVLLLLIIASMFVLKRVPEKRADRG